jgi:O-antigen/teichoic acid export membrane protein
MIKKTLFAILDQLAVSGSNFLTVILAAHFCRSEEVGKLSYLFTLYILTILINTSAIFYSAPIINSRLEDKESFNYHTWLLKSQIIIAVLLSTLLTVFIVIFPQKLNWYPSHREITISFFYLFMQQVADFSRRANYIFSESQNAALSTIPMYVLRIILLGWLQPKDFNGVVTILISSAAPIALLTLIKSLSSYKSTIERNIIYEHIAICKWALASAPFSWFAFYIPMIYAGSTHGLIFLGILQSIRSIMNVGNILMELLETLIPRWLAQISFEQGSIGIHMASSYLIKISSIVWLIGILVISMFHKPIINTLTPYEDGEFGLVLALFWVGIGIHCYSRISGLIHRVSLRPSIEYFGVIGCFIVAIASLPLIRYLELIGVAIVYILIPIGMITAQITGHIIVKRRIVVDQHIK